MKTSGYRNSANKIFIQGDALGNSQIVASIIKFFFRGGQIK